MTLIKLSKGAFAKSIAIGYTDLLFEAKFDFICKHFSDDPDELASAVSMGIVVRPVFGSLGSIIRLESRIVLYNVVSCIHEGIPRYT